MLKKFFPVFFVVLFSASFLAAENETGQASPSPQKVFRLGIIGTTTSHVNAFINILNDPKREGIHREFEVVGAYAGGMPDNPASWDRVEKIKQFVLDKGIAVYPSIEQLLEKVDGILLESVDGRCHLEQAKPVIKAGKPFYIDKPAATTLADTMEIYRLAAENKVPVFSSSSLRYSSGVQAMRTDPSVGKVLGVLAWSPSTRNAVTPAFFWYGIHGVEILFTIMGPGCERVSCVGTSDYDLATGIWSDGRIGTFRGDRNGKGGFGATVFGQKGAADGGKYEGYKPLVEEFCRFFKEGKAPFDATETLEIMAFMEAAEESLAQDGKPVSIKELMDRARREKRVYVQVRLTDGGNLTVNDKPVALEKLSSEIDRFAGKDVAVKVVLTVKGRLEIDSVVKTCARFGKATLADFRYDLP